MLVLHLEYMEWMKIQLKQGMAPFIQGACCSVYSNKSRMMNEPVLTGKVSLTHPMDLHYNSNYL
jgi:hypothetical protein